MKIAQRFIAGVGDAPKLQVPEGRLNGTQPSLQDFEGGVGVFPALNRNAREAVLYWR